MISSYTIISNSCMDVSSHWVLFRLLGQALEALAIMCFVCNVDEDKEEEMTIFWQIFGHAGVEASDQVLLPAIHNSLAVLIHVLKAL